MDPPEFIEYRRIMQPLFAPVAIERLAPAIEYYANRCVDEFIERGEVDIVHEFADPVPVMVTLHKLGLPIDEWRRYAEPMHKTVFLRQDNPAPRRRARTARLDRRHDQGGDPATPELAARRHDQLPAGVAAVRRTGHRSCRAGDGDAHDAGWLRHHRLGDQQRPDLPRTRTRDARQRLRSTSRT